MSHAEALRDARHLFRLLERSHPDPYTPMGGKVTFKRHEHALLTSLPREGLTIKDLADRYQRFLARLRDGHTKLFGQGLRWIHPADALPIALDASDAGLHVVGFDTPALVGTRGYRLVAVNGHSMAQLGAALARLTAVENRFQGYTKLRHVLLSPKLLATLLRSKKTVPTIRYTLQSPRGKKVTRTVKLSPAKGYKMGPVHVTGSEPWSRTATKSWRQPPRRWRRLKPDAKPFYFRFFDRESTAYFRVRTIMGREAYEMAYRYKWGQPKKFVARFYRRQKKPMPADMETALRGIPSFFEQGEALLKQMKKKRTRNLIVDLRGNGGGVTPSIFPFLQQLHGDAYFAHRFRIEFITVQSALYLKKRQKSVSAWRKLSKNPLFELGDYRFGSPSETKKGPPPTAAQKRQDRMGELKKKGFSFAARLAAIGSKALYTPRKVVVLCDTGTFSAAFHFVFMLRDLGAKVVGVPSGQAPNTFMEVTRFTLPLSGLRGSISNSAQIFLPEDPGAKVLQPHFPLTPKILARYGYSSDATLRYALDLLKKGRI